VMIITLTCDGNCFNMWW